VTLGTSKYGPVRAENIDWDLKELTLNQTDIDIIIAALWVAHRSVAVWSGPRSERIQELRRFFNQPYACHAVITLSLATPAAPPPEST